MPKLKLGKESTLGTGKFLKLVRREFMGTRNKPGGWEYVKRRTHRGRILTIFPVTPKNEIILTKTYRIPAQSYIIEMCAGLMDKGTRDEIKIIREEVREELGYTVGKIEELVAGQFESAITSDEMAIYVGWDAKRVGRQELENGEDIRILKLPLSRVEKFLTHPPRNVKIDLKIFAGLYFLQKRLKNRRARIR